MARLVLTSRRGSKLTAAGSAAASASESPASVVVEALTGLTAIINLRKSIASGFERAMVVRVLLSLHDDGIRLDADAVQAWARANGWSSKNAERLATYARDVGIGRRPLPQGMFRAADVDKFQEGVDVATRSEAGSSDAAARPRSRAAAAPGEVRTYVPDESHIVDFVRTLEEAERSAPERRPALVGVDGARIEIPEAMYEVLRQVADALGGGSGVAVAPMDACLTTQQAADFLGVARTTLVRMLERGELPMERPGRDRFVRLRDLVDFQAKRAQSTARPADLRDEPVQFDVRATEEPAPVTRLFADGPPMHGGETRRSRVPGMLQQRQVGHG